MKLLRNKTLRTARLFATMLAVAWTMTACIGDDLSDCFDGLYVRVIAPTPNGSDPNWIGEGEMKEVTLYVFDEDRVLLDRFPTEIGKMEHLFYPRTKKLYVASTANTHEDVSMPEMIVGTTTLSQVEIALKEAGQYLGFDCYANPPDLFSGQIEFSNVRTEAVIDLPIYRRVAAVMVRVRGLKQYLNAPNSSDEDYAIVFGTQYQSLQLNGEPGTTGPAYSYPVPYIQTGGFRIAEIDGREYYESPRQVSTDKTDYFRVFSSSQGTPVSVGIYYKEQLVGGAPITLDSDSNPLSVKNDLLNVIEILFKKPGTGASITIRVKEAAWNGIVEIEKNFGDDDDW